MMSRRVVTGATVYHVGYAELGGVAKDRRRAG